MNYFSLAAGLALGNFGYQFFGDSNWSLAIDRTFYQTAAVVCCWLLTALAAANRSTGGEG